MFRSPKSNSRFSSSSSSFGPWSSPVPDSVFPTELPTNVIHVGTDGSIKQTLVKPTNRVFNRFSPSFHSKVVSSSASSPLNIPEPVMPNSSSVESIIDELQPKTSDQPSPPFLRREDLAESVRLSVQTYLQDLFTSPWLSNTDFGQRLLKALHREPFPSQEDIQPPLSETHPFPQNVPPPKEDFREDNMPILSHDENLEFIPFFNNELYITNDSKTELKNNSLRIFIELAGILSSEPKIYPFGREDASRIRSIPHQSITFTITNDNRENIGIAHGHLSLENNIYVITFSEFTVNGTSVPFETFELPIAMSSTLLLS